jgi:exodeoxyribonuclease-3
MIAAKRPLAMTRVVTWNVNSIKAHLTSTLAWVKTEKPDVLLLQEIKCIDEEFPRMEFEDLGYNVETVGQKTYNGVAILSRHPLTIEHRQLPGAKDGDHARYIEGLVEIGAKGKGRRKTLRVASIYLPNGNPSGSEKFDYKLAWMGRLVRHAKALLKNEEVLVLGGDYNVAPTDDDVYDPEIWANDALCRPEVRAKFRELLNLGFTDAIATRHPEPGNYTFWDYQGGAWAKDHGLRIDHLLLSPQAVDRLADCGIDRKPRGKEKPSDHVPVWCELEM